MKKIGIISDTHGLLRPEILEILKGCDCIIHAGDHSCKGRFGHPPYPRGTMHRPDEMGQDYVEEVSGRRKES